MSERLDLILLEVDGLTNIYQRINFDKLTCWEGKEMKSKVRRGKEK